MAQELNKAIPYLVHRSSRLLRQNLIQLLEGNTWEISPEQYFLIIRLSERDGQTMADLTDPILKDFPNINRMVGGMIKLRLVKKIKDKYDARVSRVWLTEKGKSAAKHFVKLRQEKLSELMDGFTDVEIEEFTEMLFRFQDNLLK